MDKQELTPVERAVVLTRLLMQGEQLTTAEVALLFGMTRQGAYWLLCHISRHVPIYQEGKRWRLLGKANCVK